MTAPRLPSLTAVRSFAVAGRLLSFTAAAAELNVTQGAVSRMVRALEAELGVELVRRAGRGLALTAAGAAYLGEVTAALDRIAAATRSVRGLDAPGALAISVLPTFAMRWLVPRLPAFRRLHPDIAVEVAAGDGPVDLAGGPVDIAIRHGAPPWPGAVAAALMSEEIGVVCAPQLLRLDPVRQPTDLIGRPLLQHTTRPSGWPAFFAALGLPPPDLARAPGFEHLFMIAEAAAAGMGFALVPLFLVEAELASGRLVRALPTTLRPAQGYYVLHRPGADRIRKVRIFKAWLMRQARGDRPG